MCSHYGFGVNGGNLNGVVTVVGDVCLRSFAMAKAHSLMLSRIDEQRVALQVAPADPPTLSMEYLVNLEDDRCCLW